MNRLGRHRVQADRVINPFDLQLSDLVDFDAMATLLQAAFRRLRVIIRMPPQRIGLLLQPYQRTHDARELLHTYQNRWGGIGNPFAMMIA